MIFTTINCYNKLLTVANIFTALYNHDLNWILQICKLPKSRNTFWNEQILLMSYKIGIKISQNSYLENSILKFARFCACKSSVYLNLCKSRWVLARGFILTEVSPLKIFQVLWVRKPYKSIATIDFLKNKVVHSVHQTR